MQQITEHYEIEKELASRLRNASREERSVLYSSDISRTFHVSLRGILCRLPWRARPGKQSPYVAGECFAKLTLSEANVLAATHVAGG